MPPKEETTQITIDGKTITQVAELSAVPEVDATDGTMAAAAQQLNDAVVAFGKALADALRPVADAIVDTFRNIVDVFRNAWPEYEDEIIRSVATPRQWHLYKHGRPRVRKKWRNQLQKRQSKHKEEVEKMRYNEFYACPYCGCALDPGERCDCQDQKEKEGKHADSKDTTRKDAGASEHRAIQIAG